MILLFHLKDSRNKSHYFSAVTSKETKINRELDCWDHKPTDFKSFFKVYNYEIFKNYLCQAYTIESDYNFRDVGRKFKLSELMELEPQLMHLESEHLCEEKEEKIKLFSGEYRDCLIKLIK